MRRHSWTRRRVLALAGGAVATLIAACRGDTATAPTAATDRPPPTTAPPSSTASPATTVTSPPTTAPHDEETTPTPERIPAAELAPLAAIGQAYLLSRSDTPDLPLILSELGLRPIAVAPSPDWAADQIRYRHHAIVQDFGSDRIVEVDGWLLSQTEARLGAVAFLST